MLSAIVHLSLRFRGIVIALACVLFVYGVFVAAHAKLDVFPNFVPPQVTVQTEAPGLAPEQVETLVTRPVETALSGLGGLESLRSESAQGLSVITVVFAEGTAILPARQLLAEKLGELSGLLPAGVKSPKMSALTSATMDLLKLGLVSERLTPRELRTFTDWTLKPRLLAVPGVAKSSVFGGEVPQWQIQVQPEELIAHGLALNDVLAAAQQATGVRGAGFIDTPGQRIVIQTESSAVTGEGLGAIVVHTTPGGAAIRLRDVASIMLGSEPRFGDAIIMGRPGVLLTLASQYGANTLESTLALERALADLAPVFAAEGITIYPRLHRPASFIEAALGNIRHSLLLGAGLVAVVLFLFLGHIRTALISLTAIPLSLLTGIIVLDRFGVTLNTLTLGGLAIALGEVVDDAIIDVENILRRLRENRLLAAPRPALAVVFAASVEIRTAVVYATLIVALVFVPVLTLTGIQGSFFAPLATSYLLAILASLGVALTLTPALALTFLTGPGHQLEAPPLQRRLRAVYERVLGVVARHPRMAVGLALILCLLAVARIPFLGGSFLPEFREGHFVVQVSAAPGTSLAEMSRIGTRLSTEWLSDPRISTVEQQIGRAEQGEDPWGPHRSEFHVELKPGLGAEEEKVAESLRGSLSRMPGVQSEVMTFLGDRIGESISGETAAFVVNVFGDDLDALDATAQDVARVLATVPGARDVQVKSPPGAPRIAVRLRNVQLAELGFRPVEVLDVVQAAYQGTVANQVYHDNRVTDLAVILPASQRNDPEAIGALLLRNAQGALHRLDALADVYATTGRFSILHEGARRRQTVTANVAGRDVQGFTVEAQRLLGGRVKLPRGVYLDYGGAAEAQRTATRQLLLHAGIAGVGIVLLLSIVLGNWRNVALVLANLPFALVGGVLAVSSIAWFGDAGEGALNMGSLVGFVTLFGITTRNAIMLISHYDHLVRIEGRTWNLSTAIQGASERLVPILMTALVTGLGLLPLALGSGEAGREIEGPMAIVILGGLVTSTALNLLILPTLATRYWRPRPDAN
jgi:CzcA family heavy metal efflux pump